MVSLGANLIESRLPFILTNTDMSFYGIRESIIKTIVKKSKAGFGDNVITETADAVMDTIKPSIIAYKVGLYVLTHGGDVEKKSFYDEERVEGWKWTYDGKKFTELGSWDSLPAIPHSLVDYVMNNENSEFFLNL